MKQDSLFNSLASKIELIAAVAAIVGLAMKYALQSGGDLLLLLGMSILALIYFLRTSQPANFLPDASADAPRNKQLPGLQPDAPDSLLLTQVIAPKLANLGASVICVATLFKLLSWNGSAIMLIVGVTTLGLSLLLLALARHLPLKYLLLFALGVAVWAVPAETLIRQFHRNDPVLTQLLLYRLHHPRDRAANEAVRQYLGARRR